MSDSQDTSRESIKTYLPAYQKAKWQSHADSLEMSQSEFIRTMVQAGRCGFDTTSVERSSPDATPGGNTLETRVLELLAEEPYEWDELLMAVTNDIETRLDETLTSLQSANRVEYSGRRGGYRLLDAEGTDGD